MKNVIQIIAILFFTAVVQGQPPLVENKLIVNDSGYLETCGLNVLVFNNHYGLFGDEKASGIEIIHHGVRTATNGDVRLNPTPEQWDAIPEFVKRNVNKDDHSIEAFLKYPAHQLSYSVKVESTENGVSIRVYLEKELPDLLIGRAGFNLEFLPSAYFGKSYLIDSKSGLFPLYPTGAMITKDGQTEPSPLGAGNEIVLAPEDPERLISIRSQNSELQLFDGRNKAQNGWFVVRSLIPAHKSGKVIEWILSANTIPQWTRKPVIAHSQVGYHPSQQKIAVIELDKNDKTLTTASLLKIEVSGKRIEVKHGELKEWGNYLRYHYYTFDFSSVKEKGLYLLSYGGVETKPFRIDTDVYAEAWFPTLDIFLPEQMDHMRVQEAYRVWHGASHLDDALQAPANHEHFDLYAQGPFTDTKYKGGEHIPGLNVGGWFDAGDYDIRTQTQYGAVLHLVQIWEMFKPKHDETFTDQQLRLTDLHHPDGKADVLQQIEQGSLQLLAQFNAVDHAINGIVEAHLIQYVHLGDAVTKTDNLIYNPKLKENESDGFTSGRGDDRWAFTSKSSALNYGSVAALAAASRALKGFNDTLANACLSTAKRIWDEEQTHPPDMFRHGNTTGGPLREEKFKAMLQLLICTREQKFADSIQSVLPEMEKQFGRYAVSAVEALPYMNMHYRQTVAGYVRNYKLTLDKISRQNPFAVPITTGGWAGNGAVLDFGLTNYYLHKTFPEIIDKEYALRSLNFLFGTHPGSDISFVSGVGTDSKKIAYGNNRANFTFIAGGIVPGALILHPDFPENKEDWPFIWGENEYVVNLSAPYILLVLAANELLNEHQAN